MMKKACSFIVFLLIAAAAFAADEPNRDILIEVTALNETQRNFLMERFTMEGRSQGYNIIDNRRNAGFIFKLEVEANFNVRPDGSRVSPAPDDKQYVLIITVIRNADNTELDRYDFAFTNLAEISEYEQYLFLRAAAHVPERHQLLNRTVFIEGAAPTERQRVYFYDTFHREGISSGYTIVDNKESAGYIFRFDVEQNYIVYTDGTRELASSDEGLFIIHVRLIRNADNIEIVRYNYTFNEPDELHEAELYLFLRAAANIPSADPTAEDHITEVVTASQSKLYLRLSIDYPIILQSENTTLPGITVGLEWQFLNRMSIEPFVGVHLENHYVEKKDSDKIIGSNSGSYSGYLTNFTFGLRLLFPIWIKNFFIEPYGAFSYSLSGPPDIDTFPNIAAGGGLQIGLKALRWGSLFIDLNYMYFIDNAIFDDTRYQRSTIGIGIGYKFNL
jgi:hypothetical protein